MSSERLLALLTVVPALGLLAWNVGCSNLTSTTTSTQELASLLPSAGPPVTQFWGTMSGPQASVSITIAQATPDLGFAGQGATISFTFQGFPQGKGMFHFVPWILDSNGQKYNMAVDPLNHSSVIHEILPGTSGNGSDTFVLPPSYISFIVSVDSAANVTQPAGLLLMNGPLPPPPATPSNLVISEPGPVSGQVFANAGSYEITGVQLPALSKGAASNYSLIPMGSSATNFHYVAWVTDASGAMHNGGDFGFYDNTPLNGQNSLFKHPVRGWSLLVLNTFPVDGASISLAPGSQFEVSLETGQTYQGSAPQGPILMQGAIQANTAKLIPPGVVTTGSGS